MLFGALFPLPRLGYFLYLFLYPLLRVQKVSAPRTAELLLLVYSSSLPRPRPGPSPARTYPPCAGLAYLRHPYKSIYRLPPHCLPAARRPPPAARLPPAPPRPRLVLGAPGIQRSGTSCETYTPSFPPPAARHPLTAPTAPPPLGTRRLELGARYSAIGLLL
ncbi:hypothetical protein B0H11DRAFT_2242689 [Mycena galericulata]|nr:hypothetical protein B0H11DRAFT_2242689 [Mycena galericulata]